MQESGRGGDPGASPSRPRRPTFSPDPAARVHHVLAWYGLSHCLLSFTATGFTPRMSRACSRSSERRVGSRSAGAEEGGGATFGDLKSRSGAEARK